MSAITASGKIDAPAHPWISHGNLLKKFIKNGLLHLLPVRVQPRTEKSMAGDGPHTLYCRKADVKTTS